MATKYQYATGTGAIAETLVPGVAFRLEEVRLHLSGAAGAEDFTITMDAGEAAVHDTLLLTQAMSGVTDVVNQLTRPQEFEANDELDFAFANGGGLTWGLTIIFS